VVRLLATRTFDATAEFCHAYRRTRTPVSRSSVSDVYEEQRQSGKRDGNAKIDSRSYLGVSHTNASFVSDLGELRRDTPPQQAAANIAIACSQEYASLEREPPKYSNGPRAILSEMLR
jgi:hypothetical protein